MNTPDHGAALDALETHYVTVAKALDTRYTTATAEAARAQAAVDQLKASIDDVQTNLTSVRNLKATLLPSRAAESVAL